MATLTTSYEEILREDPKCCPQKIILIKYLEKNLPDDCTIYVQPKYDYRFPDIVILRKHHGVVIIEVNNWGTEVFKYHVGFDEEKNDTIDFWELTNNGKDWYKAISPVKQIQKYKNQMLQRYNKDLTYESLLEKDIYAIVRPVVFMCGTTQEENEVYFNVAEVQNGYVKIITEQDLKNGRFLNLLSDGFELLGKFTSKFFNQKILDIFHAMLSPSKYSILEKELQNITWSKEQLRYIHSQQNVKRKIRGVAGSGKTTVMAARAIDAYKKTKSPVLILTFNITLKNYIKDCIFAFEKKYYKGIIVDHYHQFFYNYLNNLNIDWQEDIEFFRQNIPEDKKYKTIYVDEIQDYEKGWIDFIHCCLAKDGELILWGDEIQNIYGRQLIEDTDAGKKKRLYTGIKGQWGKLSESHRCDGKIAQLAELFKLKFLTKYDDNKMVWQTSLSYQDTDIAYGLLKGFDLNMLYGIFENLIRRKKIHNDDICILSDKVEPLREFEQILNKNNYETLTTFETQDQYENLLNFVKNKNPSQSTLNLYEPDGSMEDDLDGMLTKDKEIVNLTVAQRAWLKNKIDCQRKAAKQGFQMETKKIKLSTIHSYKGWGIDTEIFIISKDFVRNNDNPDELIYTAITRAKTHLMIINLENNKYNDFFRNTIKAINDGKIPLELSQPKDSRKIEVSSKIKETFDNLRKSNLARKNDLKKEQDELKQKIKKALAKLNES